MTTEIEDIFNNISPPEEADGGSRKKRRKDAADKIPDGVYQAKIVEFSTFHKDDDYGNRDYWASCGCRGSKLFIRRPKVSTVYQESH